VIEMAMRRFYLTGPVFLFACLAVFGWSLFNQVWAGPAVALDAAHGGADAGLKAGSETEKEWNLKFVKALQKALAGFDVNVIVVRKGDEGIEPQKRQAALNTSGASAAVIIHVDREKTGTQNGPLLVVEPPTRSDGMGGGEISRWGFISLYQFRNSLRLAKAIGLSLGIALELNSLSDSRGLGGETPSPNGRIFCLPHQDLRYLTVPSVVLTPLFLTSKSDLAKFSKPEEMDDFAAKVAKGLASYFQVSQ
jgi:N-acetylmuramoyl-L-alanine amidase